MVLMQHTIPKPHKIICPECNVNRDTVKEMLADLPPGDNYWTARAILNNCKSCEDYFRRGNETYKEKGD